MKDSNVKPKTTKFLEETQEKRKRCVHESGKYFLECAKSNIHVRKRMC